MSTIIPRRSSGEVTTLIDDAGGDTTYFGRAKLGTATNVSKWQILRISVDGTVVMFQYANGSRRYNQKWDDRADLTYSN